MLYVQLITVIIPDKIRCRFIATCSNYHGIEYYSKLWSRGRECRTSRTTGSTGTSYKVQAKKICLAFSCPAALGSNLVNQRMYYSKAIVRKKNRNIFEYLPNSKGFPNFEECQLCRRSVFQQRPRFHFHFIVSCITWCRNWKQDNLCEDLSWNSWFMRRPICSSCVGYVSASVRWRRQAVSK